MLRAYFDRGEGDARRTRDGRARKKITPLVFCVEKVGRRESTVYRRGEGGFGFVGSCLVSGVGVGECGKGWRVA